MDPYDFDYRLTEKILSAMLGLNVNYAKPGQASVRLTPLNQHIEGILLNDGADGTYPYSEITHKSGVSKDAPFLISTDLIDPHYDFDFTKVEDNGKYVRGSMEYRRPCGWKRLAISVKNVYDNGSNAWLSMKQMQYVWGNCYLPTDLTKIKEHLVKETSYQKLIKENYDFDIGVASMQDIDVAEKFAQTVELNGVKYKFLLQCRVSPKGIKKICEGQVFVCTKECIRPYGFLIKKEEK